LENLDLEQLAADRVRLCSPETKGRHRLTGESYRRSLAVPNFMSNASSATEAVTHLDPPNSFLARLRFLGPSLILTATLVGSGELIVTTTLGAKLGFVALWLVIGSCVLKVAMQEALGRYVISSGDTSLQALNRLPGPRAKVSWAVWVWILVLLLTATQLGAIATVVGEALNIIFSGLSPRQWAPLVCVISLALLYNGRYEVVERWSTLMVILFSTFTILSALLIQRTSYAISLHQLLQGLKFELPSAGWGMALAVVGAVGLSASELLYYPYWCLEKGYASFIGPNEKTDEWTARAQGWIKVMQLDCYLALLIYTTVTLAFYFLGAAVLHARGEIPAGIDVLWTLSSIYTQTFGPWAFYLFIGAGFFVLFSTLFVSIASYSRLMSDCLSLFGIFHANDLETRRKWIRINLVVFTVLFALASQMPGSPISLIVLGLSAVALMLPMVCFAVIYLRYQRLDPRLKPSLFLDIWLWASALLTVVLTIYTLFQR
jgi:manganese transport protein